MAEIKVGDIVTIMMEESFLWRQQGEVVSITNDDNPEGPVGVHFERQCAFLFSFPSRYKKDGVMRFTESDLRVDVDGYTPENRADILFPNFYNFLYVLKDPIDISQLCMHNGCENNRVKSIFVNTCGTVQEFHVCETHAKEWDGRSCDGFPCRK